MAIKRDHSNLPAAKAVAPPERKPDADPWLIREVVTAVTADWDRPYEKAIPELPFRFSDAAGCARALAYGFAGVEHSNPLDEPSLWIMGLGSMVHDIVQAKVLELYPDAQVEVTVDGRPMGLAGSGHSDVVMPAPEDGTGSGAQRISIELKSINGFSYKTAATTFKGPPTGPRRSALVQGCLNAKGFGADLLIIAYFSLEAVGVSYVKALAGDSDPKWLRIAAQWTYTRDEFEEIATAEVERIGRVLAKIERSEVIPRSIPLDDGTPVEINNPRTGAYTKRNAEGVITFAGSTWHCNYCRWQDRCADEPEYIVPPEAIPRAAE